jgi:hypothetical protein
LERIAPLAAPALGAEERAQLEAGATLVRDLPPGEKGSIGVLVMGLVDAPPQRVWEVMADCEHEAEFLPRVVDAAMRDRIGDEFTCELVVDLPFPLADAHTATRNHVRRLPDGGFQRWWQLVPGEWSYRRDDGSWTVHPYEDGRRSLLVHRLDIVPKTVVPGWILRAAGAQHAPATFQAIRARVSEVAARSTSPAGDLR